MKRQLLDSRDEEARKAGAESLDACIRHLQEWPECPLLTRLSLSSIMDEIVQIKIRWLVSQSRFNQALSDLQRFATGNFFTSPFAGKRLAMASQPTLSSQFVQNTLNIFAEASTNQETETDALLELHQWLVHSVLVSDPTLQASFPLVWSSFVFSMVFVADAATAFQFNILSVWARSK